MKSVVFLTRTGASDVGHGGIHRSYQILFELEQVFGQDQVYTISVPDWLKKNITNAWDSFWKKNWSKLNYLRKALLFENPNNLFAHTPFTTRYFVPEKFWAYYRNVLVNQQPLNFCVIDDSRLAKALPIHSELGIPTILVNHNIESLELGISRHKGKNWRKTALIDFANELHIFEKCQEILVTSKVEAGLIGGLGLTSHYYPYIPVGVIRKRLLQIREQRAQTSQIPGLFLMLGSASHATTRDSMLWFIKQLKEFGLSNEITIQAVGYSTDTLLEGNEKIAGFKLRGWVSQDELDELLVAAAGALIPQRSGFGALVRIPELFCAGVPVIAHQHAAYARGENPSMCIVRENWSDWNDAINKINSGLYRVNLEQYLYWENKQPNPFAGVLKKYI